MVFPIFLFGVGAALGLSFPRTDIAWGKVARRVAALVALGLVLNWAMEVGSGFWFTDPGAGTLAHVRVPGILQRIAFCYLLGVLIASATARRGEGGIDFRPAAIGVVIAAILLGYWALMMLVPVPGHGAGQLDPAGNLAGYIDRTIFTPPHLWRLGWASPGGPVVYDPEGLLSTLPATVNLLFGMLAARAWRQSPGRAPLMIAGAGLALFVLGTALDPLFVVNKRIWTSSFALLSSGFAAMVLAALMLTFSSGAAARIATPLRILGGNAILAFTLSTLLSVFGGWPFGAGKLTPQKWGNDLALGVIPDPHLASLACALGILALVTLALWPLHRRAIHFRL